MSQTCLRAAAVLKENYPTRERVGGQGGVADDGLVFVVGNLGEEQGERLAKCVKAMEAMVFCAKFVVPVVSSDDGVADCLVAAVLHLKADVIARDKHAQVIAAHCAPSDSALWKAPAYSTSISSQIWRCGYLATRLLAQCAFTSYDFAVKLSRRHEHLIMPKHSCTLSVLCEQVVDSAVSNEALGLMCTTERANAESRFRDALDTFVNQRAEEIIRPLEQGIHASRPRLNV
mmetsp:Transcript_32224/g.62929  ORF Transcript_32224/g.62929 Transcript_32224/m.62929 type:complete len:231 (-) Transcript_32224:358-1050(-)|eukprot:CAMPEP_0173395272 /NCGR_PEP_ID=MMETSP1356-20130122/31463_1 /TAXON_ID=77927 ORGANISM="Hemiselmis virescens, Strain PCC157" /NCGR_SAMPLE_ID=MMETSP1356 /ASSEMBLY_ACC=CAM_ASM_000847 /LENGTH=230 /DNA_ID=CAMNT_0014353945 /DNA_START=59 /DNA_END=751 /DNA_ORIENTATION=-